MIPATQHSGKDRNVGRVKRPVIVGRAGGRDSKAQGVFRAMKPYCVVDTRHYTFAQTHRTSRHRQWTVKHADCKKSFWRLGTPRKTATWQEHVTILQTHETPLGKVLLWVTGETNGTCRTKSQGHGPEHCTPAGTAITMGPGLAHDTAPERLSKWMARGELLPN